MATYDATLNYFRVNLYNGISVAYIDTATDTSASQDVKVRGTIMLIHGFPETSYQFRDVVPILMNAGYRVLAPDYRGAGESAKPNHGFTKAIMAADLIMLLDHLRIEERIHVVGHETGGMVAFALASRWPERIASVCISECLLPGTKTYHDQRIKNPIHYFHLTFHCVANLPEALIVGRERTYIEFFITKLSYRIGAFSSADIQRYVNAYSQPGALRCALELYRALDKDAEDLSEWQSDNGRCRVPCMLLSGEYSSCRNHVDSMATEVFDQGFVSSSIVTGSGHFGSEENPRGFAEAVLGFVQNQNTRRPSRRS